MTEKTVSRQVVRVLQADLCDYPTPLRTVLGYRVEDPFAVVLSIRRPSGRWIHWWLARDLLTGGLAEEAGIGDVRVASVVRDKAQLLEVTVSDRVGSATLRFDRASVERFVLDTFELVPAGTEASLIDFDTELAKLVNGHIQ